MVLNKNFLEFLKLLEENGVRYLLVGGYAVGFHGFPRYTGDLDIFIAISPENADKLLQVFEKFGFADIGLTTKDFLAENFVVEVGREPQKIQILTGIDGVNFDECYKQKVFWNESGQKIPMIGLDELIKNKAASPRGKDKIDLEELKRIKKKI